MPVNDGLKILFGYLFNIPWYLSFVGFRIDDMVAQKFYWLLMNLYQMVKRRKLRVPQLYCGLLVYKKKTFEGKDLLEGTIIWLDDNLILDLDWDSS